MGILDWFKTRSSHFEAGTVPEDALRRAYDKALTLANPHLCLLRGCQERLLPAVRVTMEYLRERTLAVPSPVEVSDQQWGASPVLRAFFANAGEIPRALGHSRNLRVFFDKFPALDEAFIVLGMNYREQFADGALLQGDVLQRGATRKVALFDSPRIRICGHTDAEVRHLLGNQAFEYLVAQAMHTIGAFRSERAELEENGALIRARLRMLQMQGPGLGSLFEAAPASSPEQRTLEAHLLENERQLEALGRSQEILETELDCLCAVLEAPERYLRFDPTRLRLNTLNAVLDPASEEGGSEVAFTMAVLKGEPSTLRAFVLGRLQRVQLPPQRIDFAEAERLL